MLSLIRLLLAGRLPAVPVCFLLVLSTIHVGVQAQEAVDSGLRISLESDVSSEEADGLPLRFRLTNTTRQAVCVLKWNTPLEHPFSGHVFEVSRNGQAQVKYTGRIVKRGQPQPNDFIRLEAGQSIVDRVDVTDGYAISEAGDYSVRYRSGIYAIEACGARLKTLDTVPVGSGRFFKLQSKALVVHKNHPDEPVARKVAPAFAGCSGSERSVLDTALSAAEELATESSQALQSTSAAQRSGAERYTEWFGDYTASRYARVSEHFNEVRDVLANRQVTFECNCDTDNPDSTFAFVFTNQPYHIHLCGAFWRADLVGSDSKAGTIVHEVTHFNVVAGTDDHVYGQGDARSLAKQDPDTAIDNADSHEYFAENTPQLSMGNNSTGSNGRTPGGGADTAIPLTLNQPVSGAVPDGGWVYYRVSGATRIRLDNLSADLDLYVKAGGVPGLRDFDCNPFLFGTAAEVCDVNPSDTVYIGVNALIGAGNYTLTAEKNESSSITPQRGLWWNPSRNGSGFDIERNGDQLTVVWYTYNADGSPTWYLANGRYANNQGEAVLQRYRWNGQSASATSVGSLNLNFTDATHADLSWSMDGQSGSEQLEFFTLSTETAGTNHSGIWYEPALPGYGLTVVEQGSWIVTVLYFYDAGGNPRWALGTQGTRTRLNSYRGACPSCAFSPPSSEPVGNLDLVFSSISQGTLSTTVDLLAPLSGRWAVSGAAIANFTR